MCGIFAYFGPDTPDPDLLAAAAAGAAARGPHGHGWAGHGIPAHHARGPLNPAAVRALAGPRILGHARLATFGDHTATDELQPIHADGHLVVHNGNIYNAAALAGPGAATDSIALAWAYAAARRAGNPPAAALGAVLAHADHTAWAIVVLDATGDLIAHRRGLPLWRYRHTTGTYLSSRWPPTTQAGELAPDTVHQWSADVPAAA